MEAIDLARAAAVDFGHDVVTAVEAPPSNTRSLGIPEAMAIGGFLVQCAQAVIQIWNARQERTLLVAALADNHELLNAYPSLDPEKRMGLMAGLLAKFLPESFGRPTLDTTEAGDKRRWISDYLASRKSSEGLAPSEQGQTRDFVGFAILQPFADQFWWILREPVGWIPDASDGPDVVRVDVPKGFVTDLTSVPSYLWGIIQKTGRYGNAAIYHDWLYWEQQVPRAVADRVLDRAMHDMGVDAATRKLIWAGVRVFGGRYWDENKVARSAGERRVLARFPDRPTITWDEWRQRTDVFA